jgi:ABC-type phosphate transport system substrate-binding protein
MVTGMCRQLAKCMALIAAGLALSLNLSAPALADVVAVVSAKSPLTSLSQSQASDIFLGKASHFPDGTQAAPIDLPEGSAARDEFYVKVTGKSAAQLKAYWSKIIFTGRGQPPPTVADGVAMKKRILENAATIGYIDRALVDSSIRVLF